MEREWRERERERERESMMGRMWEERDREGSKLLAASSTMALNRILTSPNHDS